MQFRRAMWRALRRNARGGGQAVSGPTRALVDNRRFFALTNGFCPKFTIPAVNGPMGRIPSITTQARRRAADHRKPAAPPAVPHPLASALVVATMVVLVACVFVQDMRWALVAPLIYALFAAVWADTLVAVAMPVLAALVALPLTMAGRGPLADWRALPADRLQLVLVYAALIACCTIPVVIEQARRRRQIALLSRKAAHFREKSQRADCLIEDLRRAALTDPLTGLANRRAFEHHLGEVIASAESACLAIIDIDHFKAVNDRHGHATGDAVLRQFAELARASLRSDDLVSRIGGEEFAVILRIGDLEQACKVCQRLVDRVGAHSFATPAGAVRVTISTGMAMLGGDGEAALAAADRALYAAKRAGRARLSAVA